MNKHLLLFYEVTHSTYHRHSQEVPTVNDDTLQYSVEYLALPLAIVSINFAFGKYVISFVTTTATLSMPYHVLEAT